MKKLFLSIVAAVVSATTVFAQSSMLATLSHGGDINVYYGATALRDAHAAAENGDVITLSSGTYVATDITKAVTIRGAGMGIDTTVVAEPTVITGDFTINIADTVTKHLTMEGIYTNSRVYYSGTLKNAMFMKCRFGEFRHKTTTSVLKDASFIHCRVATQLYLTSNSSASCINSVINVPYCFSSTTSTFEFVNCVVRITGTSIYSSSLRNSVVYCSAISSYLPSSTVAYNCIGLNSSGLFGSMTNQTNTSVDDIKSVFKSYDGSDLAQLDNERFELTDGAQQKYLGGDGTQVGIYGGSLTYDPVPSNPQITKCNVAAKSTADGKLSVDIQVATAE